MCIARCFIADTCKIRGYRYAILRWGFRIQACSQLMHHHIHWLQKILGFSEVQGTKASTPCIWKCINVGISKTNLQYFNPNIFYVNLS